MIAPWLDGRGHGVLRTLSGSPSIEGRCRSWRTTDISVEASGTGNTYTRNDVPRPVANPRAAVAEPSEDLGGGDIEGRR